MRACDVADAVRSNELRRKQLANETEKVYKSLEGKDLRLVLAEVIVQLRHQKECRHDVRY